MKSVIAWLRAEVFHLELDGKTLFTIRRHHTLEVTAILTAVLLIVTGAFVAGRYLYPYRVKPAPPLGHNLVVPACKQHVMGACLPHVRASASADITASSQGPDFSNNDPVFSAAGWNAIAAHNSFSVFKVIEGTGFVDRTAAAMAASARARHLVVGGYDFLHVCVVSATAEAHLFAVELRADNLLGPGTLPPTGDAEWPLGSLGCNGRVWLATWAAAVKQATGRQPDFYTGAWWWQPHIGCWWPAPALAWVSGYGVRFPFMPCGRSQLDVWQFADNGWNGATSADLSVWRDGAAAFHAATLQPTVKPKPRLVCFGPQAKTRNRTCVKVRATVAGWTRARDASARALTATQTQIAALKRNAGVFRGRVGYFDGKARALTARYA